MPLSARVRKVITNKIECHLFISDSKYFDFPANSASRTHKYSRLELLFTIFKMLY
jgi:hypothetical protein